MILKKLPGAFQGIVAKVEFCQDRVFIKYCVFSKILKYIPDSGLFLFSLSVCAHTRQVEHTRCSRTGRVQNFKEKTQYLMNTL